MDINSALKKTRTLCAIAGATIALGAGIVRYTAYRQGKGEWTRVYDGPVSAVLTPAQHNRLNRLIGGRVVNLDCDENDAHGYNDFGCFTFGDNLPVFHIDLRKHRFKGDTYSTVKVAGGKSAVYLLPGERNTENGFTITPSSEFVQHLYNHGYADPGLTVHGAGDSESGAELAELLSAIRATVHRR